MPHFVVTFSHPDPEGWAKHLKPHLDWIVAQVESGRLRASGPTVSTTARAAALVFLMPSRDALQELMDTDPYFVEGQVADVNIIEWDPIFGDFHNESSRLSYTEILDTFT